MSRDEAIAYAVHNFDNGVFLRELSKRIAIPSESQNPLRKDVLEEYLRKELASTLRGLGFDTRIATNPAGPWPLLVANRFEDTNYPTALLYGHGDVSHGLENQWEDGLSPWQMVVDGDRVYGRGSADSKGQHSILFAALSAVCHSRSHLGFNTKILIETGEEVASKGLRQFCLENIELLKADVLIASDGPRLSAIRPTLYMGSRGAVNFELVVSLREGSHHSGNWGGILANPVIILSHALASLTTKQGVIKVLGWRPPPIPRSVQEALSDCLIDNSQGPLISSEWGEPGLSFAERLFAWNSFEILAITAGTPDKVVSAIPPCAVAHCQLRFIVDCEPDSLLPSLREHLDTHEFRDVQIQQCQKELFRATRLLPDHPWAQWAAQSMELTLGKKPAILPNLGASLPNDVFADVLGLPTLWIPHSYPACSQHAPNEHALIPLLREGLQLMTGLFWDLGEPGIPAIHETKQA